MRISDWSSDVCSSDLVGGAGGAVPDDDGVGAHRLQGQRGVLERLALGDGGALGGEVDDVGGQPLGGRLERYARSEEHTSEPQSLMRILYAVLCLKKKMITLLKLYVTVLIKK